MNNNLGARNKIKFPLLLLILLYPAIALSQPDHQEFEKLNIEKVMSDIDTIKNEMNSNFYYINATYKILKEEVELFGWKKTIQMNSGVFLPIVIFGVLYLLWLRGRRKT